MSGCFNVEDLAGLGPVRIASTGARRVSLPMGTMPELGVGSTQALMFAAHPGCRYPTEVEPSVRWYTEDVVMPMLLVRDGRFDALPGPGLEYTVDVERAKPCWDGSWRFGR